MSQNNIPILDLRPEIDDLWEEIIKVVHGVLRSGHFIMGPNVDAFEREVAEYLGVKHAIGVNSGTDALVIGLRAAGVGPGDEVITTPFTFFATSEAITMIGARPIFVDINESTFNIDTTKIESVITSDTKAILPVHLFGLPAEMDHIMDIANEHSLLVVEDCAQSFGAEYRGVKTGAIGNVGCFSFFPSKNLGAYGDGGLITTNDDSIAVLARMLRVHGSRSKYYNELVGYNSRLDEIQAAILRVKLNHIERSNQGRLTVADRYTNALANIPGIITPTEVMNTSHVYHQYTIRVLNGLRDDLQRSLSSQGVGTMVYYPKPVHKLPIYESARISLPVSEAVSHEVLSLPIWPAMVESEQEQVVSAFMTLV